MLKVWFRNPAITWDVLETLEIMVDKLTNLNLVAFSRHQNTEAEILSGHGMDFRRPMYGKTKVGWMDG